MKLRFTTSVASGRGSFLEGRVIEVEQPVHEIAAWLRSGVLVPVREADPEIPRAPRAPEQAIARDATLAVPRLVPRGTVVCLGCGPSLTAEDVDRCRDQVDGCVAVNDSYRLAPWATALYAADARWWRWHAEAVRGFPGLKYSVQPLSRTSVPEVIVLENTGDRGLELAPTGLRTGQNSGYQAINLAVLLGASRIVLLGYDMKVTEGRQHWHTERMPGSRRSPYSVFQQLFPTMVTPLKEAGVEVLNCSRQTALTCFPRKSLTEVFTVSAEVAA